jgi:hypothetical protein
MDSELREKLSDLEHDRWSRWMRYMFSVGKMNEDGSWTMPPALVVRWKGQMETSYGYLSEGEKDSDRKEADNTLKVIDEHSQGSIDPSFDVTDKQ